jgi:prepilin signal peptidase PulO-like enzyme (type II secretory pathway)
VDQFTHKIRNRDLALTALCFSFLTFFSDSPIHPLSAAITLILGIIGMWFGLGAGDVKLAVVLSVFFLPLEVARWTSLVVGFSAVALLLVITHLLMRRSLSQQIALAPAICAAFIWCAR